MNLTDNSITEDGEFYIQDFYNGISVDGKVAKIKECNDKNVSGKIKINYLGFSGNRLAPESKKQNFTMSQSGEFGAKNLPCFTSQNLSFYCSN